MVSPAAMFEAPKRYDVRVTAEGAPEYWAEQVCQKLIPTFDPKATTVRMLAICLKSSLPG